MAANDLALVAEPVPNQPGVFFYGPLQANVPFGNGTRCIDGQIGRLDVVNANGNVMTFLVDNTSPPSASTQITAGSTWNFQAWFRDPVAGGAFFDLSDALSVTFGPLGQRMSPTRDRNCTRYAPLGTEVMVVPLP